MSGKVYVVGFGPGDRQFMTQQAVTVLEQVDLIVGYTTYVELLRPQFPKQRYLETPMRREVDRCRIAAEHAASGKTVALVSGGDSGVYGMAGIMLETAEMLHGDYEVIPIAGMTAASAAAAVLGAPLMHDFAVISLSDLLTPLERIYRRVTCAAAGDFVICLYNPKSRKRTAYLAEAVKRIQVYRSGDTPVGIVRNAGRQNQQAWLSTLENLPDEPVDMFCVVLVGNSQTYVKNGRMITPRGYTIAQEAEDHA